MPVIRKGTVAPAPLPCPYPAPFHEGMGPMTGQPLGDQAGLTQFGAHIDTLMPGGMSSQRHWHACEDEFLMILSGEATLIDTDGAHLLRPGDAAAFPAGDPNGHCLRNDGTVPCAFLIFGSRRADEQVTYPDIDMVLVREAGAGQFRNRAGTPYPKRSP